VPSRVTAANRNNNKIKFMVAVLVIVPVVGCWHGIVTAVMDWFMRVIVADA